MQRTRGRSTGQAENLRAYTSAYFHFALTPLPRTNRGLAPRSRRARGEGGDFRKRKRDHAITDADCAPFKKAGELRTSTVSFAWLERHDYKCLHEEERPFVRLKDSSVSAQQLLARVRKWKLYFMYGTAILAIFRCALTRPVSYRKSLVRFRVSNRCRYLGKCFGLTEALEMEYRVLESISCVRTPYKVKKTLSTCSYIMPKSDFDLLLCAIDWKQ